MGHNWSLEGKAWKNVAECNMLVSWGECYLHEPYKTVVPPRPGVYIVASPPPTAAAARLPSTLCTALYVGQAKNLQNRFQQHIQGYGDVAAAKKVFAKLIFYYAEVPVASLSVVETALWNALRPSANKVSPPIKGKVLEPVSVNPGRGAEG